MENEANKTTLAELLHTKSIIAVDKNETDSSVQKIVAEVN